MDVAALAKPRGSTGDAAANQVYDFAMTSFIEHIVKLTDHRDRDLLELTLSKALIDLLPIGRIVIAHVMREDGVERWLEVARLDAKGGGRVIDPQRVDFQSLVKLEDASDRLRCLQTRERVEIVWAGPEGPRINMLPLFSDSRTDDRGVLELHSDMALSSEDLRLVDYMCRIYRNMYTLLEYSDRDALTGLLNRKSLENAFYSAVLEDLDGSAPAGQRAAPRAPDDRRHRVPANYWLGSACVDDFAQISNQHGHAVAEDVLQLVARIMSNTFRTYDLLYHFGAEDFGVLMHCPDEALVLSAFDRFRGNVEKFNFPHVGRLTVSCGYTSVTADDSPVTALEKTQLAVNFVRRGGGNKTSSHLGLVRRGFLPSTAIANAQAQASS